MIQEQISLTTLLLYVRFIINGIYNNSKVNLQTWGGGTDSYFEYLIKYGRLTNNADTVWVKNWLTAVDSSIIHLAQEPVGTDVEGLLYLGDWADGAIRHIGSHLACFHGKPSVPHYLVGVP